MHHRTLGRTGTKINSYARGAPMPGSPYGNPAPEGRARTIHKALNVGYNFIGTAGATGAWATAVGEVLKGHRDDTVLATRFNRPMGEDPSRRGPSRRGVFAPIDRAGIIARQVRRRACGNRIRPPLKSALRATFAPRFEPGQGSSCRLVIGVHA